MVTPQQSRLVLRLREETRSSSRQSHEESKGAVVWAPISKGYMLSEWRANHSLTTRNTAGPAKKTPSTEHLFLQPPKKK